MPSIKKLAKSNLCASQLRITGNKRYIIIVETMPVLNNTEFDVVDHI